MVGDSNIVSSNSNLGVIFDKYMKLIIILVVFVNQLIFKCVTLVAFGVFYLIIIIIFI